MKKKLFFLLFLLTLGFSYLPSWKFYQKDINVNSIEITSDSRKMIAIPGYTNILVYNSDGYYLTTTSDLKTVVTYLFP
jgi:hypothetical protein